MQKGLSKMVQAGVVMGGVLVAGQAGAYDTKLNPSKPSTKSTGVVANAKEDLNEAMLNTKVRMKLLKSLKGADSLRVSVTVKGTTVMLSGEVEDRASEKVASEAAKSVDGVTNVRTFITHNPKAANQDPFEARVKDAMLAAEVRFALLQELGGDATNVHITATDGVVSMRGELANTEARDRAVDMVKEIAGVQRVEDLTSTR